MQRIIECVPNFSEGRDEAVIQAISAAVQSVEGVRLLNVDPGKATNRTVYTFVGEPEAVCEAAVLAAKVGSSLIDMSVHKGEHPRIGAMDVCPLVPIAGVSMDETVAYARALGKRLGDELGLTVFLYEEAATTESRRNLAAVREGEFEGLEQKLNDPLWKPDFGPAGFNPKSGATIVGARDFLVAYNINLNTTSERRANSVAFDVREKGRKKREGDPITGKEVLDSAGQPVFIPGTLKSVKAIGWYIEEYGIAQISMNLTNISVTPLHVAFDEVCTKAAERGMRVTGSELVGLVPKSCLVDAGRYFMHKQQRSSGVSESELIRLAIRTLGLDELGPFDPTKRIIEFAMREPGKELVDLTLASFITKTASESPAPGGGSISATMGAMAAALGVMVANLSGNKRGWDGQWREFSDWADRGKAIYEELLFLIDEDTRSFNHIMDAMSLPKSTQEEKAARSEAIQTATKYAIETPLRVMDASLRSLDVLQAMALLGNPNSVSDAGVGVLAARSAVLGAGLNVKINCSSLKDEEFKKSALQRCGAMTQIALDREREILAEVESKL